MTRAFLPVGLLRFQELGCAHELARKFHTLLAGEATECSENCHAVGGRRDFRAYVKTARRFCFSPHELKATAKTPTRRASGRREDQSECEKCGLELATEWLLASSSSVFSLSLNFHAMSVACETPTETAGPAARTLAQHLGETAPYSPLWHRARALGLRDSHHLLAFAAQRGARHYAGLGAPAATKPAGREGFSNEEVIGLLLHGLNPFEPFLIRAAAELIRHHAVDAARLVLASKRERCQRVLAYIAQAGADHDAVGSPWWKSLLVALGPQRPVPAGLLPHWSRFVALQGIDRQGRDRGSRWIGAAA